MFRVWLVMLGVLFVTTAPQPADAQPGSGPALRLGVGTFLSRDGGWNYREQVEVLAAITQKVGSVDVEAGGSVYKSFGSFSYPAVFPRPPIAFHDGFAARLHVRTPGARTSALSGIVGVELFHNRTDGQPRTTTAAGSAGIGFNFGSARSGSLDLRYVRFAEKLGSSTGILPLTLTWRL